MAYITLLSDFGLQDASVAVAKGILMQYMPDAPIVDITHEIQPFNKQQAAYILDSAYKNFPEGTIHLSIIDIFSGSDPSMILCAHDNHYFLCPDNGIMPLLLDGRDAETWLCMELGKSQSFHDWLHKAGAIIKALQNGRPVNSGDQPHKPKVITDIKNEAQDVINCEVVHIDLFGNVILSAKRLHVAPVLASGKQFLLKFIQYEEIKEISNNYADVREGFKLCRFNSNGNLEISINKGNAASLFGLTVGGRHNNVQITFK